jgi:aminopeptidase N
VEVLNAGGIKADGDVRPSDPHGLVEAAAEVKTEVMDAAAVAAAKERLWGILGASRLASLPGAFQAVRLPADEPFALTAAHEGRRALGLELLSLWCAAGAAEGRAALVAHCQGATNMTDRVGALGVIASLEACPEAREACLAAFDDDFGDSRDAIDAWLSCQAASKLSGAGTLVALMGHRSFSLASPNKVRAVFSVLALRAPAVLQDPEVLALLGQVLCDVDALNGNLAASLAKMLAQWRAWPGASRDAAQACLQKALARPGCSKNLAEVATLALG